MSSSNCEFFQQFLKTADLRRTTWHVPNTAFLWMLLETPSFRITSFKLLCSVCSCTSVADRPLVTFVTFSVSLMFNLLCKFDIFDSFIIIYYCLPETYQFCEIFRTHPDRPWGLPSLLYNGFQVSFPGLKRPRRGNGHPPHLTPRLEKE